MVSTPLLISLSVLIIINSSKVEFQTINHSFCRETVEYFNPSALTPTFSQLNSYVNSLYGRETIIKEVDQIISLDMVYSGEIFESFQHLEFESWKTLHDFILFKNTTSAFNAFEDFSWVEVTRMSSVCLESNREYTNYVKSLLFGRSTLDIAVSGCSFLSFKGTGIFVNAGKTMISTSWCNLLNKLGMNNKKYINDCPILPIKDYCKQLLHLGYDSFQIVDSKYRSILPQIHVCSDKCLNVDNQRACPPLILRTGWNASDICNCNNQIPLLNCQQHSHLMNNLNQNCQISQKSTHFNKEKGGSPLAQPRTNAQPSKPSDHHYLTPLPNAGNMTKSLMKCLLEPILLPAACHPSSQTQSGDRRHHPMRPPPSRAKNFDILVLFTSDMHGHIETLPAISGLYRYSEQHPGIWMGPLKPWWDFGSDPPSHRRRLSSKRVNVSTENYFKEMSVEDMIDDSGQRLLQEEILVDPRHKQRRRRRRQKSSRGSSSSGGDDRRQLDKRIRKESSRVGTKTAVVMLDGGDAALGTKFFRHHGIGAMYEAFSRAGYSAVTLGNHDMEHTKDLLAFAQSHRLGVVGKDRRSTRIIDKYGKSGRNFSVISMSPWKILESLLLDDGNDPAGQRRPNPNASPREEAEKLREIEEAKGETGEGTSFYNNRGDSFETFASFSSSSIIVVNGLYLGIIGFPGLHEMPSLSQLYDNKAIHQAVLQHIIDKAFCLKMQVDLVILVSHGGQESDEYLSKNIPRGYVDVILSGHEHNVVTCERSFHDMRWRTPIIRPGYNGEYVVGVHISFSTSKGIAIRSHALRVNSIPEYIPKDMELFRWLEYKSSQIKSNTTVLREWNPDVLRLPEYLSSRNCRQGPCLTGKIITKAINFYFQKRNKLATNKHNQNIIQKECLIVLFESGSIRNEFAQTITEENLQDTLPWNNKAVRFEVSGFTLVDILRESLLAKRNKGHGGAYLQITVSYSTQWLRSQPSYMYVCLESFLKFESNSYPLEDSKTTERLTTDICETRVALSVNLETTYTIAVSDWVASGGDGYGPHFHPTRKETDESKDRHIVKKIEESDSNIRDLVRQYLLREDWNESDLGPDTTVFIDKNPKGYNNLKTGGQTVNNRNHESNQKESFIPSYLLHGCMSVLSEMVAVVLTYPLMIRVTKQQLVAPVDTSIGYLTTTLIGLKKETTSQQKGLYLFISARFLSSVLYWIGYEVSIHFMSHAWIFETSADSNAADVMNPKASGFRYSLCGFLSSVIAGILSTVLLNPLWVILTHLQAYATYPRGPIRTYLCRGIFMNILLVLYPSIRQFIYNFLDSSFSLFSNPSGSEGVPVIIDFATSSIYLIQLQIVLHGFMGLVASLVATIITYPIQVQRTRLQAAAGSYGMDTHTHVGTNGYSESHVVVRADWWVTWFRGLRTKLLVTIFHDFIFFSLLKLMEMLV